VHDIAGFVERVGRGGVLEGGQLLAVASTLAAARRLRRTVDEHADSCPELVRLVADLRTFPEIEQEIYRCIEDSGEVADRASEKLRTLRANHRRLRSEIQGLLLNLLQRRAQCFQEHLITQRGDRFVLPVKVSHRDQVPGIVHDVSASGQTLYVEPLAAVDPSNRLREGQRAEQVEVERILGELSQLLGAQAEDLTHLHAVLVDLDAAAARARYAAWLGATRPSFSEVGCRLERLRHPLLVWQHRHEQGREVVPVDLPIAPQVQAVVITGPNTGGKTVTLKTLGLAALMARAGLYVSARDGARLPWFDRILADIGDEQSIEQNLSTFSGHIRRIVRILGEAGAHSLVLLDEVGAGTDPQEGSALARALLVHLARGVQLVVATTHYGELKALKYTEPGFENASVEFDTETLGPTYRLLWGVPGRSNALYIATRLGLDTGIIADAQASLSAEDNRVDQVIGALQAELKRQEQQASEAERIRREVERTQSDLIRQQALLDQREGQLRERREREVREAIAEARAEVARVIRTLQQGNASARQAQQASQELQALGDAYLSASAPMAPAEYRPQPGDRVEIASLGQTGEVVAAPDASDQVLVRVGVLRLTVPLSQIRRPGNAPARDRRGRTVEPPPPRPLPRPDEPLVRTEAQTIDLRGRRVSEAEAVLEPALNLQRGPLWVIHGHGTGKLREGVHQILERHPRVARFEFADPGDGGNGVTVVFLK
jgi:DNA mismatch repair protein MutS2